MKGRAVRDGLFRAENDGGARLLGGRCVDCAVVHFPRGTVCPYCSAAACDEVELGPNGKLWLFTAVLQAPPGYRGSIPFGFGVVDLDEGLRVVSRLTESDPAKLAVGQPMRLVVDRLHTDEAGEAVYTYAFAAVSER